MSHAAEIHLSPGKGLHLRDLDLWMDSRYPQQLTFVSHAHSDHVARHQKILCSPVTAHLLQARYRIARERLWIQEFLETIEWQGHELTLLPAGHIAGSAMLHVRHTGHGASLLYTGDYKLRSSRSIASAEWREADTLIMESTFGLPHYVLPSKETIERQIIDFVEQAFADDDTPVLLGYSLGKAQEIAAILSAHSIAYAETKSVSQMTNACREAGIPLPEAPLWSGELPAKHALIAAPSLLRQADFSRIRNPRSAMMTGWALQPSARFRYGTDAAIPLSDHADFPDLMRTAELVKPRRIITIHGYTRELAASLRARNFQAWSHFGGDQLELFTD